MSSRSGKKKLVAAAALPLSVSIAANSATSQTPTAGIKLVIGKNRIVSVPSTKSQPIVVQRQSQVVDGRNAASLSQPQTNAGSLRFTGSNNAGDNATLSYKTVTGTHKICLNKNIPVTSSADSHGTSGEMRVKVTGEDVNRNGQSILGGGGQLKQVQLVNSVLGRRMSINRRFSPAPTTQEPDSNKGQKTVTLYNTTVRPADGHSLLKHQITSNDAIKSPQPASTVSTAAATLSTVPVVASASNLVPVSSSNPQSRPASIVVAVSSTSNAQFNQGQGTVSSSVNPVNGKDESTATSARKSAPIESVKNVAEKVAVTVTATQTNLISGAGRVESAATMATAEEGNDVQQQPTTAPVTTIAKVFVDEPTTLDAVVLGDEIASKPSREMKSLQVMQAKSKVLSEYITDTSSKGKLRKRCSDSIVDAAVVGTVRAGVTPPRAKLLTPPRKRKRRGSADDTPDNSKELATDDSHKLEDVVNKQPATRVRKIRSTKSEYKLLKRDRNVDSFRGGAKFFLSSLNLQHETNDQSFPGEPPKPGWDRFCWRCKMCDPDLGCSSCIRSYHKYCVRYITEDPNWSCTECKMITNRTIDIESFVECLGYSVKILSSHADWRHFFHPINKSLMPHYDKYITRHMDLVVLNEKYEQNAYKSPEAFMDDVGWIVHNMSIYPDNLNILKKARLLHKRAKQEMDEMDPCYECYKNDNTLAEDRFREPCSKPHLLVWAKMKGYPYWPGKLMAINANNQAFVRYFGTHDRSWISVKECYLFSQRDLNPHKQNLKIRLALYAISVEEVTHHIAQLREQFTTFNYGSFKEAVDPSRFEEHQRTMFPGAFLKNVKVTIKRSEGEMVAVASAVSDETESQIALAKTKTSEEEMETTQGQTPVTVAPATKALTASPPKRMTRRMSRFMKATEELTSSQTNAESTQDLVAPSNASLRTKSNNDKSAENKQTSDVTAESDKEATHAVDTDCNPKNLSLLLRRGSQSWETEPLSKRGKHLAVKSTVVSAVPKAITMTLKAVSKAKETQETLVDPDAEKVNVSPNVQTEKSVSLIVDPTGAKSSTTDSEVEDTQKKKVVETIAENFILAPNALMENPVLASVALTKTKVTVSTANETVQTVVTGAIEPVAGKITCVSSNSMLENNPPSVTVNKMAVADAGTHNVPLHSPKHASNEEQISHTHAHTTVVNSSVVTVMATKLSVNPLLSKTVVNTSSFCTTTATSFSETASKAANTTSTINTTPTSSNGISIKQEIVPDDEVNVVECPKDVPAVQRGEPVRNGNSTSSVSSDVTKRQDIVPPVSTVNVLKPVQQTPPAVLPISSTTIAMVTSNQRARKSFPGGASNATKHASAKQATSLVHNVTLPASIAVPLASPLLQQTATVSIPKELVTTSPEVSLIPCTDNRKSVSNEISNDTDDVLIIEEEISPVSVPSKAKKIGGLPPPLLPRPPETSLSLPSDDDSMMELNRTMQLFDDSSNRVLDHIRTVMEDLLKDMSGNGSSLAELAALKLNHERQQELWLREKEKQQNAFDSRLAELRNSLEQEKLRALNEQRQQLLRDKQRAVQSAKMKQWCKKCLSEAHYYCCWNTSYCSIECQKKHWTEHHNDCTQDHAKSSRSVHCSSPDTNSVVSSDGNSSSNATKAPIRNRSCLQVSTVPSVGGGDTNNLLSKRSPSNRVFPSDITSTSTPLPNPSVRFIPGTLAGSVSYKTPVIQSVHGRDGMIINIPSHSPQNGSNVTLGVTTNVTTSTPQQLMQKRAAARDKSNQLTQQKADSRKKGYSPRNTYDITSTPYQSTNNLLTSSPSTSIPSAASTYATVMHADAVTVSGVSPSVWNQMAILQSSGSRQLHSGSSFVTAGGASVAVALDGTEKGYLPVELGFRQTHPTVTSLAQHKKMVQQQPSSPYMRHQQ
ncbi:protein kinase C-binding protein 1 [Anopheles maculipalpis]|uniref:protein kinase C-binding protein 1 n=1 Tax=Anopheles maculipalpis TaxID=1496333 RepID=UPI002158C66F|nr:protein kinase C-binding protein 1 [Anopheles maculipalpis]